MIWFRKDLAEQTVVSCTYSCREIERLDGELMRACDEHAGLSDVSVVSSLCRGNLPQNEDLLQRQDIVKLKRCIYAAQVSKDNNVCVTSKPSSVSTLSVSLADSLCVSVPASVFGHIFVCSFVSNWFKIHSATLANALNYCLTAIPNRTNAMSSATWRVGRRMLRLALQLVSRCIYYPPFAR